MKAQLSYRISKALNAATRGLEPFYDTHKKLIEKYKGSQQGNRIIFSEDPEEQREAELAFSEELKPVLEETVSLNGAVKISVKKLGSIEIAPNTLAPLDWLLED